MKDALLLKLVGRSGAATMFVKLNSVFPECEFLISDLEKMHPLNCLVQDGCPRNQNCMERLVSRTQYLFDTFPDVKTLLLYFRYRDRPGSHRAGVFHRDMRAPRFITFNQAAWEKCKAIGTVYAWHLPDELFLQTGMASDQLIPLRIST